MTDAPNPFRSDLDALRARQEALESEVSAKQKELGDARRLVAEATAREKLPVLDNIRVAAPCTASWDKMTGDERVRACGECNKNVFNLSAMTRDEAEALIIETAGRLCVRYFQRADGTIMLKDCTIGVRQRRKRRIFAGAATLLAATGVVGARAQAQRYDEMREAMQQVDEGHWLGGAVALPDDEIMGKFDGAVIEHSPEETTSEVMK